MPTAQARHILVPKEDTCADLKAQIEGGADFAELAREHSTCRPAHRAAAAAIWVALVRA